MTTNFIFPDVSFYQDDNSTVRMIDFDQMRRQTSAVMIRAGQNSWVDQDLAENMKRAQAAGLARGTYWFYDSRISPKKQAELYIAALRGDLGELPLVADLEEKYKGPYAGWRNWFDFINALQVLAPEKKIMIYTGYYYWTENTSSNVMPKGSLEWFKQFPLWIAAYGAKAPRVPKPWTDWTFWQFTDNGDGPRYGAESKNIDLNYFQGDEEDLRRMFKIGTVLLPAPAVEGVLKGMTLHFSGRDERYELVRKE